MATMINFRAEDMIGASSEDAPVKPAKTPKTKKAAKAPTVPDLVPEDVQEDDTSAEAAPIAEEAPEEEDTSVDEESAEAAPVAEETPEEEEEGS